MSKSTEARPELEDYWRAIILFGRNTASYKFALGKTLLGLAEEDETLITLDQLAVPYARHLTRHLKNEGKQNTQPSSRFLDACRAFNAGHMTEGEFVEQTVRLSFNNVIDAFHVVNRNDVGRRFFVDDRAKRGGYSSLTISTGSTSGASRPIFASRWRRGRASSKRHGGLISPLACCRFTTKRTAQQLYIDETTGHRIDLTFSRDVLTGYQKGHCFNESAINAPVGRTLMDSLGGSSLDSCFRLKKRVCR